MTTKHTAIARGQTPVNEGDSPESFAGGMRTVLSRPEASANYRVLEERGGGQ